LGDGTTVDKRVPVQIGAESIWVSITTGDEHTLALKSDGTIWAWGNNYVGQLGDGTFKNKRSPGQIGTGNTWVLIAAGGNHSLALKSNNTLWEWGRTISIGGINIPTQVTMP
jgi:alpha-tubulin suppressor-like RCC1 family protein